MRHYKTPNVYIRIEIRGDGFPGLNKMAYSVISLLCSLSQSDSVNLCMIQYEHFSVKNKKDINFVVIVPDLKMPRLSSILRELSVCVMHPGGSLKYAS